jgi:hypothetical protein
MEAAIWSVVGAVTGDVMEITEVECRTTVCRAIAVHKEPVKHLNEDQFQQAFRLITESFMPLFSSPDSRINSLAISGSSSPERTETFFTLRGPPLDAQDTSPPQ